MKIKQATLDDLKEVAELFNLYRIFYNQESNIDAAYTFLKERLVRGESIIFLAYRSDDVKHPAGFAQLYPTFSSVGLQRTWILNDLYVNEESRGQKVGETLLNRVIEFAKETSTKGILLETGEDNLVAQNLYEKLGFAQEQNRFYFRTV